MNTTISKTLMSIWFLLALSTTSLHAQVTGWLQTDAGSYNYTNTANWVGGTVNGIWDSSLTLTAAQTVTFDANTTLATGFSFLYGGSFNDTLRSDGTTDYTLTLGGDITVNTVSASRVITIGSTTANQKLNINLGGAVRKLDVRAAPGTSSQRSLTLNNAISNGSIVAQGGGTISLNPGAAITNTFSSITLKNAQLGVGDYSDVTVTGTLIVDGIGGINGDANAGGISMLTLYNGKARFHPMTAGSLIRTNNAVALFRGANLGNAPGNYVCNLTFTTPPTAELVGGGGAEGTTTISIIPWALGGTLYNSIDTFVTYGDYGIRPLNITTEFTNRIDVGTISSENVKLPPTSGTTTNDLDTTINSLYMPGSDTLATVVAGAGTLTVTSGAIYLGAAKTITMIDANVSFGNRQGVIGYGMGMGTAFNGAISGSTGLVLYQSAPYVGRWSSGTGITFGGNAANSSYTGDVYINGRVFIPDGFLPSGSRTGDVFVQGLATFSTTCSINGLTGFGEFGRAQSGPGSTLSLGGNNANGDFDGVISDNGPLSIKKIGSGTQRLGGRTTYDGTTTVEGGTLIMDGYFTNTAVTVKTNTILRGKGTIDKSGSAITVNNGGMLAPGDANGIGTMTVLQGNVVFINGATLKVKVGTAGACLLNVAGVVTNNIAGSITVPVTVEGEGPGKWLVIKAVSIVPAFTSATSGCTVTIENSGTELWVNRSSKGTLVSFQ